MIPPTHRVRSDHRLAKAVAEWVEIDAASARGYRVLYRQLVRMVCSDPSDQSSGERQDVISIRSSPDRNHYMHDSASRGLGKPDQLQRIQPPLFLQTRLR